MSAETAGVRRFIPTIPAALRGFFTRGQDEVHDSELGLDETLDLVANARRRRVVDAVATSDGPIRLGDLSEWIAAEENDKPLKELTSDERKRVYVGLYQAHLEQMEKSGIIELAGKSGPILPGPEIDAAKRAVDGVREAVGGESA